MKEIIRFAVSGGVCFLIEFALLVLLRDTCGLDTLGCGIPAGWIRWRRRRLPLRCRWL